MACRCFAPLDDGDDAGVGAESGTLQWRVVRDIDAAAQAANDWNAGGDGNYPLGLDDAGAPLIWTIVNTGVADVFGPNGTTGVRFNASAGTTTLFNSSTRTATHMWILAASLIPDFDPLTEYIIETYFSSLTLGTTGDEVGAWAWNASGGSPILVRGGRRNASGVQQTTLTYQTNANGTPYTDDAFAMRFNTNNIAVASGLYGVDGFPDPYPHLGSAASFAVTPVASPLFDPTTLRIGVAWPANTAGNADSTLARIRISQLVRVAA